MVEKKKKPVAPVISEQSFLQYGKIPPQAVELEEVVLGAMMLEKDALANVIEILKPEVFYKDSHKFIFEAIYNLFNKSQPVDILTVTNELKTIGLLEVAGGPYYVAQLTSSVASSANIEYHSRILLQKFIQRELIRISSEISSDAFEDTTDVFELLDKAERNLFNVSDTHLRRKYSDMHSILKEAIKEIETAKEASEKNSVSTLGVPSGFYELDKLTAGWQKSDLIILAGRPSMGKTAFVLSLARNASIDWEKPVAFFSLEMSAIQLVMRLISLETELPSDRLRRGNLEDHEWEQLNYRIKKLENAQIFIDDTPALSVFELRAKSRRLVAQHNVQLIIVDYLQLMSASIETRGGMREQEISSISRALKGLAKELNIPIIALSQLSREVEKRPGSKRPILSDLRESGAIEQDADLVMFIYRPEYYKIDIFDDSEQTPTRGLAEIILAKHRNGQPGEVKLRFKREIGKFSDFEGHTGYDDVDIPANENFYPGTTKIVQSKMNKKTEKKAVDNDNEETPF
ncbi:MAG: replicative DNA helicase [Bacteroidales bacterium]|jgi:replicative DNA helicase|nr:replicative DNA helicase [Bacteroidales bacterium]MDD4215205.1 replicative DNA helicase [Bacteroidales bacterium]